jgi:hypothetical protein
MTKDLVVNIKNSIPMSKFIELVRSGQHDKLPAHGVYGVYQHSTNKIVYVGQANSGLGRRWARRVRVLLEKSIARSNLEKYLHSNNINDFSIVNLYSTKGIGKVATRREILNPIEKYFGELFDVKKYKVAEKLPTIKGKSPLHLKVETSGKAALGAAALSAIGYGVYEGVKRGVIPLAKWTFKNIFKMIRI